jgi:hypothetical protein
MYMESNPFVDKTGEFGSKEIIPSTSSDSFMGGADVKGAIDAALAADQVKQPGKAKFVQGNTHTVQKEADAVKTKAAAVDIEAETRTNDQRIAELEEVLSQLKSVQGVGGVKIVTPNPKAQLDFTKITEKDVYDLSIPIEAIMHHVPDLTKIELKDKNYIARYINVHPGRMGPMKAAGFTYINKEDIESIAMDIQPDENGHYRYIDTVAMKCPKIKYLGALRANYERSVAVTDKNVLHRIMKNKTSEMLGSSEMSGPKENNPDYGKNYKREANKYQSENKLEVYI